MAATGFPIPIAAGTLVGDAASISPAWPAHETNDIGILVVECADAAPTLSVPAGFTQIGTTQVGGSTPGNRTRAAVYWARATSGAMGAPTITTTDDHILGRILTFRGCKTTDSPINVSSEATTGSSNPSAIDIPDLTTTIDRCLIVAVLTRGADQSTSFTTGWTSSDLHQFTLLADSGNTTGHGGGIAVGAGWKLTAGLVDDWAGTIPNDFQNRFAIALLPDDGFIADAVAPKIENLTISGSVPIRKDTVLGFDVIDETSLALAAVIASWTDPDTGKEVCEVVHDGSAFRGNYNNSAASRTAITGGYRFTCRRDGGWPQKDGANLSFTLGIIAVDGGGNLGVVGNTGNLSSTLGALTTSAAGTVRVSGASATTLGTLTTTAAGTVV